MSKLFIDEFKEQQRINFKISDNHGFEKDSDYNFGTKIALMHAELSEALESYRMGDPQSDHIPEFSGVEEEYADVIIRIMNDAERHGFRVAEAMLAKQKFNAGRPYKHGGKKI